MKTAKEILRTKGITEKSKNHVYDYLYKSTIEAMEEYAQQFTKNKELSEQGNSISHTKQELQ